MITDLLETSRLEAGAVTYHPGRHDLGEIARSVLDEMQPLAEEGGIALFLRKGDGGMSLVCDDQRIGEVVANLVGNAVKFSPPETSVAVDLRGGDPAALSLPPGPARTISSEHGPFLMISVSDEGPGVPDEHKEAIFNKFHQVERGTRIRGQGVGLGLAISRRIVESHGGAVWVEDRAGGGAVFKVVLPSFPARWRGLVTGDAEQAVAPSTEARAALAMARGSSAHAVMLFLAVLPLAGCRVSSEPNLAPPSPELPAPDLEVAEAPEIVAPRVVPPGRERLDRAQVLLAEGSFEEAGRELQRVLELGPSGAERSEALWGMALVHLYPNSPLHDPDRGLSFLIAVGEEFPASLPANQASWARLILEQLAGVRREAHAQQELLQELNEALEVLRQIDLDRRPSGAPRPDPGTAPRPGR
jgi:hypothetical protein